MSYDGARPRQLEPLYRRVDGVGSLERALWGVVALSLLGDVVTTFLGLHLGLSESNPVARSVIDGHGFLGMMALKTAAVGVALACRMALPKAYGAVVPAGLALPWTVAVCINLYVISLTL